MKPDSRPRCIWCDAPIAKKTSTIYFRKAGTKPHGTVEQDDFCKTIYLDKLPDDKAAAQRYLNKTIVSVSRGREFTSIQSVSVWDGESYDDPHFHTQTCAAAFGSWAANMGVRKK